MCGQTANPGEKASVRVLAVDDEPAVLRFVARTLAEAPEFVLDTAANCVDATRLLETQSYDLVLTDVNLPDGSGIGLLATCRRQEPRPEVILITGKPDLDDAVSTVRTGAYDYLAKPIGAAKLRASIAAALTRRKRKQEHVSETRLILCEQRPDLRTVRLLGTGSMGMVFLVERAGQLCALKVLRSWQPTGGAAEQRARFVREAEVLSSLDHPNIVRLLEHDLSFSVGRAYLLMEYVEGEPITVFAAAKRLAARQRLGLIRQVAVALDAVHGKGIVHRDIKPENILVRADGHVKVTDFGIARLPQSSLTQPLETLGSPAYMAPESFDSEAVDPRADLFSLGVVAYEVLTGTNPFRRDTIPATVYAVRSLVVNDPLRLCPDLSRSQARWLLRLLAKEPQRRFASAAEAIRALDWTLAESADPAGTP